MNKVYFISDLHLSHFNVMRYEPCRVKAVIQYLIERNLTEFSANELRSNFDKVVKTGEGKEFWIKWHDNMLIDNWNSIVKEDDVVWFLGDLGFGKEADLNDIRNKVQKLKGHKKMIYGNHDKQKPAYYYSCGFEEVSRYSVVLKGKFLLSHAPNAVIADSRGGDFFNIFGHVHSKLRDYSGNGRCVCVEVQDFKPVAIPEFDEAEEEES